jgi:hypothetical protein
MVPYRISANLIGNTEAAAQCTILPFSQRLHALVVAPFFFFGPLKHTNVIADTQSLPLSRRCYAVFMIGTLYRTVDRLARACLVP